MAKIDRLLFRHVDPGKEIIQRRRAFTGARQRVTGTPDQ
jgi:hypothetical protein